MVMDSLCFSVCCSNTVSCVLVLGEYPPLRESEEYGSGWSRTSQRGNGGDATSRGEKVLFHDNLAVILMMICFPHAADFP